MRINTLPIKILHWRHEPHAQVKIHSRRRDLKTLKLCAFF